jgi:histone deacetylase complex subunit SAP18
MGNWGKRRRGGGFGDQGDRKRQKPGSSREVIDDNGPPIDRDHTCPLLLRVFPREGGHHLVEEFDRSVPPGEAHFYTWKDATLRELAELVKEASEAARLPGARFSFALV